MNVSNFIYRKNIFQRFFMYLWCKFTLCELPPPRNIGKKIKFPHGLNGIVLHPTTIIGNDVTIFHQVTCGRGDVYANRPSLKESRVIIKNGVILCAGAKIICNRGPLVIGENSVIGANAVLTKSTGPNEIWAGVPARFVKKRE